MFCMSSEKEICIAREKARPVLSNILSSLLRSGVIGYFNWQRDILATSEWASAASACGPCRRSNPEDVKQILKRHGVLVEAAEFIAVRNAYSDSVGFILTDLLLNNLKPLSYLSAAMQAQIKCVHTLPLDHTGNNENTFSAKEDGTHTGKCTNFKNTNQNKAVMITQKIEYMMFDEVKEMVNYLSETLRKNNSSPVDKIVETVQEDAEELFCTDHYPHCLVPLSDVYNFIAAECLMILEEGTNTTYADYATSVKAAVVASSFRSKYETCKAGKKKNVAEATSTPKAIDGTKEDDSSSKSIASIATSNRLQGNECNAELLIAHFQECTSHFTILAYSHAELSALSSGSEKGIINNNNVQHQTCLMNGNATQSQRKFERYCSHVNRRDEWLRGRDEREARDTYQRHVVGYGGHLPEYQYHFGRTFHIIEEDLPKLSQPKNNTLFAENQAQYGSGETIALRRNCMNEHHFKLS